MSHPLAPTLDETSHRRVPEDESCPDGFEPLAAPFATEVLARLGVDAATRLLEVAAGTGGLTLAALDRGAEVTAIDASPRQIAHLRRRLSTEQRWRTSALVMDGQDLALPATTFDAACSLFGLTHFPAPDRALREIRRVLKPGGRFAVAVWGDPRRHEALRLVERVLCEVRPGFRPAAIPPPWLCYQNPETLRAALAAAGFAEVAIHTLVRTWQVPSVDWFLANVPSLAPGTEFLFPAMGAACAEAFAATVADRLHAQFGTGPIRLAVEVHLGVGRRL